MHVAEFFHGKTSLRNAPKSLKRLAGLIWQASYRNHRDVEKEKSLDAVLLRRMFYVKRKESRIEIACNFFQVMAEGQCGSRATARTALSGYPEEAFHDVGARGL